MQCAIVIQFISTVFVLAAHQDIGPVSPMNNLYFCSPLTSFSAQSFAASPPLSSESFRQRTIAD